MKYGYARVSTMDQDLQLQIDALKSYGVNKIYKEKISGASNNKPVLTKLIKNMEPGSELVVWKLDRLGRNSFDLIKLHKELLERNIKLVSITEKIENDTAVGKMLYTIMSSFAEMERSVLSERTKAGLEAAKKRGIKLGRRPGIQDKAKAEKVLKLYRDFVVPGYMSVKEACLSAGVCRTTFYKYLKLYSKNK
jgi:DNA invertase Pin-like site-specific DNA recombinase